MTNDRDDGATEQAKGSLQDAIGKLTGNPAAQKGGAGNRDAEEAEQSAPSSKRTPDDDADKSNGSV